ncbi:Nucleoside-triphosphatase [Wickerhamomyces ciferrii]|uniref:Inosine triphosphate pyrophosphatase n=1 Tax=Wickerhamomyces ciferrii (strain ATCC 14091 / BCRC 22168 / CBS 111 / JCM 3599 / NBRC 0793 / NRRL Y-1031 F-60-10) TaxID=1206466 RepID=K0K902_WICCF|nr:Nucleoside-triphosphatase [Wickerhamomyces ciferrii]CCH41340.1 Nucleoside-triphosphatase [Wickerhamomyces ciferrii]
MSRPAITFVTGNAKKLKEFQAIIGDDSIKNQSVDLEEIQGSIKDISIKKVTAAAAQIKGPVLVEDTCLVFSALSKPGIELPGPYIKWFVDSVGVENLPKLLAGFEDKSAQTVCTFAFTEGPGEEIKLFQGITEGKIVEPRYNGDEVFGFDPIFEPIGFDQTFGEMDKSLKNTISHRFRALEKVKEFLKTRK